MALHKVNDEESTESAEQVVREASLQFNVQVLGNTLWTMRRKDSSGYIGPGCKPCITDGWYEHNKWWYYHVAHHINVEWWAWEKDLKYGGYSGWTLTKHHQASWCISKVALGKIEDEECSLYYVNGPPTKIWLISFSFQKIYFGIWLCYYGIVVNFLCFYFIFTNTSYKSFTVIFIGWWGGSL